MVGVTSGICLPLKLWSSWSPCYLAVSNSVLFYMCMLVAQPSGLVWLWSFMFSYCCLLLPSGIENHIQWHKKSCACSIRLVSVSHEGDLIFPNFSSSFINQSWKTDMRTRCPSAQHLPLYSLSWYQLLFSWTQDLHILLRAPSWREAGLVSHCMWLCD